MAHLTNETRVEVTGVSFRQNPLELMHNWPSPLPSATASVVFQMVECLSNCVLNADDMEQGPSQSTIVTGNNVFSL